LAILPSSLDEAIGYLTINAAKAGQVSGCAAVGIVRADKL
jgi:hypothetical protein